MAIFKVEIPDFSSIKVGDIVKWNGLHELIRKGDCLECSLSNECEYFGFGSPCGDNEDAIFKKVE